MAYDLILKNRLEELERLSDWLGTLSTTLGVSPRGTFRIQLAAEEAVTNIIQNAYQDSGEHDIVLGLVQNDTTLELSIHDDGQAFDLLLHPEVNLPSSLETAKEGGLGIHLIRNYADECHYQRSDGNNILRLVFQDNQPSG